jgi:hypothetical protein
MIPKIILERLARVKARELAVTLAWGAALAIALAAGAMTLACLVDWLIDLRFETPGALRALLLVAQVSLWIGALAVLVARPLLRPRSVPQLALWAEGKFPELGHRVITAVELNREGAKIEGMSGELIAAVTRQAEDQTTARDFASRVDLAPAKKAAGLVGAVGAWVLLFAMAAPETVGILVCRQFLSGKEIPRSVALVPVKPEQVWPSGEEGVVRFHATGKDVVKGLEGEVRIDPVDRPSEYYTLTWDASNDGISVYKAVIPPGSVHFEYKAWLGDGRSKKAARVQYEPRPVVQKLEAWVVLPEYCGLRPGGGRYEQFRPRGEVAGPKGSGARLVASTQKPVVKGRLEVLGPGETGKEEVLRSFDLSFGKDGQQAEATFDLKPGESVYRIQVEDRHGFANLHPPRRGITIVADEPPRVVLLPERFGPTADPSIAQDSDVEGMPIPLGSRIRVAYYCSQPYGLDRARLAYRVIKGGKPSDEPAGSAPEVPWQYLPLGEVRETDQSGPFDLREGTFVNFARQGLQSQVEFHPMPSPDPDRFPSRLEGGGRFDFQTAPLKGVLPGDQIEFFVEAFAKNPDLERFPGRSETRSKTFVTQPQFMDWVLQTLKHENRLRQLESRQRGVFTPEGTDR